VATADVILNHLRVTLAIRFVVPGDDPVTVVTDLQKRLKMLKIRVACLFLARGFDSVAVMESILAAA
jgi:hypothetical protein